MLNRLVLAIDSLPEQTQYGSLYRLVIFVGLIFRGLGSSDKFVGLYFRGVPPLIT